MCVYFIFENPNIFQISKKCWKKSNIFRNLKNIGIFKNKNKTTFFELEIRVQEIFVFLFLKIPIFFRFWKKNGFFSKKVKKPPPQDIIIVKSWLNFAISCSFMFTFGSLGCPVKPSVYSTDLGHRLLCHCVEIRAETMRYGPFQTWSVGGWMGSHMRYPFSHFWSREIPPVRLYSVSKICIPTQS